MPFPYNFTFDFYTDVEPFEEYQVQVDWNNDGDFDDANEDISDDVKSIHYSRGKDEECFYNFIF